MDRVLLAVYGVEVYRGGDSQLPGNFGNSSDLLKLFKDFVDAVLASTEVLPATSKKRSYRFTCCDHTLTKLNEDMREVYGFFHTGRDGDNFVSRKFDKSNKETMNSPITSDMYNMRDTFFYLKVPKGVGRKKAYLIIQQTEGQGIKGILNYFLDDFIKKRHLSEYRIVFSNLIPEKVFNSMMSDGLFKELTLIKYGIPNTVEGARNQEEMIPIERGKMKVIYQATNLGSKFKEWGLGLFGATRQSQQSSRPSKVTVQLYGEREEYDEVSMLLELNGKQKTFHLASSTRTQPDIDVTNNVRKDGNGRLRLDQLLEQARELVADVTLDLPPHDSPVQN